MVFTGNHIAVRTGHPDRITADTDGLDLAITGVTPGSYNGFLVDDYGLSSDYKLLRREAQVNKNQIAQQFLDLALESKEKLDGPQRKLLYNLMNGNLDAIDDLAEEGIELNLKTRKVIEEMGQKYVDLDLLDKETFFS